MPKSHYRGIPSPFLFEFLALSLQKSLHKSVSPRSDSDLSEAPTLNNNNEQVSRVFVASSSSQCQVLLATLFKALFDNKVEHLEHFPCLSV